MHQKNDDLTSVTFGQSSVRMGLAYVSQRLSFSRGLRQPSHLPPRPQRLPCSGDSFPTESPCSSSHSSLSISHAFRDHVQTYAALESSATHALLQPPPWIWHRRHHVVTPATGGKTGLPLGRTASSPLCNRIAASALVTPLPLPHNRWLSDRKERSNSLPPPQHVPASGR